MDLYRLKGQGWQFFIWPHKDNNPIIAVSYWGGYWLFDWFGNVWTNDPRLNGPKP